MRIRLERTYNCKTYCIGHLYVDGKYICDTIEDVDRGLDSNMSLDQIRKIKVKSQTAIPTGVYRITMNVQSPKFSQKEYYRNYCKGYMPRLLDVKGFDGILIHRGVNQNSSSGCLIVGENKVKGQVINSQKCFEKLYTMMRMSHEPITIEIVRKFKT